MNTTYTLTFDQDSLKALNLPVFTLNHLKVLEMDMEGIEDGLSACQLFFYPLSQFFFDPAGKIQFFYLIQ
ncbi:hypothetical protein [Neisseria sp.]